MLDLRTICGQTAVLHGDSHEFGITSVDTISGHIERVVYHNPENGFAVLKVSVPQRHEAASVVGQIPQATAGEFIEATGSWVVDKRHGQQFKAELIRLAHPATPAGIKKYLASGLVKGIGPALASQLVDAFGVDLFDIVDHDPQRLRELPGIGRKRSERIATSLREQRAIQRIMIFLHDNGLGTARAVRIYKTYGNDAIELLKRNPYRLVQDVRGIGFKAADELASRLGIDPISPMRARAGLAHVLQTATTEGHCALPENELIEHTADLLELDLDLLRDSLTHEIQAQHLVRERVGNEDWVYLAVLHDAETQLAVSLKRVLAGKHPLPRIDVAKALEWVQDRVGLSLGAAQQRAIEMAVNNKVLIITGGPGVGKTTIVDSILKILTAKELTCTLCAPTGRAAKRLSEATGREARTIHRLLEFDPFELTFKRNAEHPLETDVLLIDEMSMVDVWLASAVMQAVPAGAAVIFVGDVDQLPSVGPGNVLGDLIDSGVVPTVRLTEIFRQASRSGIVRAAYQVNTGEVPDLQAADDLSDFHFAKSEQPESAAELLVRIVTERIPARYDLDPVRDVQVLTPMHRGVLGARHLNSVLQATLNPAHPSRPEVVRGGHTYRLGDKVLQVVNNYNKEVFNGDLGLIDHVDLEEQELHVGFDGRVVTYEIADLDELIPAYAMTIHKSQGSEFPAVVLPVHTQHFVMLQRNLLYTAITRGKQLVVMVGTYRAVEIAVSRAHAHKRYCGLHWRLTASPARL